MGARSIILHVRLLIQNNHHVRMLVRPPSRLIWVWEVHRYYSLYTLLRTPTTTECAPPPPAISYTLNHVGLGGVTMAL